METRYTGAVAFPDNEAAAVMYDRLADQLTDELKPQEAMLIGDIVRVERIKALLLEDIEKHGVRQDVHNGRQRYVKDNPSIAKVLKIIDQQRRTMQAIGLVAKDGKAPNDDGSDEFDEF